MSSLAWIALSMAAISRTCPALGHGELTVEWLPKYAPLNSTASSEILKVPISHFRPFDI